MVTHHWNIGQGVMWSGPKHGGTAPTSVDGCGTVGAVGCEGRGTVG